MRKIFIMQIYSKIFTGFDHAYLQRDCCDRLRVDRTCVDNHYPKSHENKDDN
jgi:hypothetical protein